MTEPRFDPEAILTTLLRHDVRFVVIGGIAARVLGSPIITRDLDICYARERENLESLAAALRELGAKLRGVREAVPFRLDAKTLQNGDAFTFTTNLGDLDVLGTPTGTRGYDDLDANATPIRIGAAEVRVVSLDDLIRMKRAAGRVKDRLALEELGALREEIAKRRRR
ncbi:MAG: hypothetical protein AUH85_17515 [Chloroflexi bacterium 13_1_40CM_4_68_4]|nr:MAG: hypothetical protein AUH85_17515 [Chloroflexi bacterium 13_1_40CM_4_68_4]